jgi:hypothetical protein
MCYHGAAHFENHASGHEEFTLDPRDLVVGVEFDPTNVTVRPCNDEKIKCLEEAY